MSGHKVHACYFAVCSPKAACDRQICNGHARIVGARSLPNRNTEDFWALEAGASFAPSARVSMPSCARVVCVVMTLAAPAAAQSTTEDGIRAVLRGDYPAAVRILRPLADDPSRPDPAAQFFLAILHETGHAGDRGRACTLFLRAAQQPNPFAEQSAAIAAVIRNQLGPGASLMCVEHEGWQGGPPQSFVLGPEHRIVFTDTSVRVTDNEQEQATMMLLPPGIAFLPIEYTPLNVTRPTAARRHFFQWFVWMPDTTVSPSSWTLRWTLSEVVGDGWYPLIHEVLAVVKGATRPTSDPSKLVRLRVNANGEAEFTITGDGTPRTEVIPTKGTR